jgi:hypothetical protein
MNVCDSVVRPFSTKQERTVRHFQSKQGFREFDLFGMSVNRCHGRKTLLDIRIFKMADDRNQTGSPKRRSICVALFFGILHEGRNTHAKQASENFLTQIEVIVLSSLLQFLCSLSLTLLALLFCVELVFESSDAAVLPPRTVRHDPVPQPESADRNRVLSANQERDQSMFLRRLPRTIVTGARAIAVVAVVAFPAAISAQGAPGSRGSNARSGPAAGGAVGTVDSVSTLSFAVLTSAGQTVTVQEASSTEYRKGTNSIPANAITKGDSVLVLGIVNGPTIMASHVIVQPADGSGSAASSAAGVVPFQRGAPSAAKQVGQIPSNYSQGSGTIVSGTEANKATEVALASYPGGIVNRVVELSNGDYVVHNIGVNWPHHIFVSHDFKVVGAF